MRWFRNALAAGLWGLCAQAGLAEGDAACQVELLHGAAQKVTGTDTAGLEQGMQVAVRDRVVTAPGGRVVLLCPDGLRITIGPDTVVVLTEVKAGEQGFGAFLPKGIARFARPLFGGARFQVRTPSAVASVRSTVWIVEVEEGATAVFVEEGQVDVSAGRSGAVALAAGDGIDVSRQEQMTEARAWAPSRVQSLRSRLAIPAQ